MSDKCITCGSCFAGWRRLLQCQEIALPYSLLLVAPAGKNDEVGLPPEQVRVEFSASFARKPHAIDSRMHQVWAERLKANPRMYSGPKFRFAGSRWEDDGVGNRCLVLQLSITEYKDAVGIAGLSAEERTTLKAE